MGRYNPPSGYRIPGQPYSRFGYDGSLWTPGIIGKQRALMPSGAFVLPPPAAGLTFWFDARTGGFSDFAGASPSVASFGRVARVDQPTPAPAGSWLTSNQTTARAWLDGSNSIDMQLGALSYFAQPVGLTVPAQNCVWGFSFQHRTLASGNNTIFGATDAGGFFGLLINLTLFIACNGATHDTGVAIPDGASVYGFARWTAGNIDTVFFVDGVKRVFTQAVTTAAGNTAGVTIGLFAGLYYTQLGIGQLLGYTNASPVDTVSLLAFLAAVSPIAFPASAPLILVAGDSISVGAGATPQTSEFFKAQLGLAGNVTPPRMLNDGTPSINLTTLAANYPTSIRPFISALRRKNIVCIQAMTNSMPCASGAEGPTSTSVLNSLFAYADQARADGAKVILGNCLPRSDAGAGTGFPACWNLVNAGIAANGLTHADALCNTLVAGMSLISDSAAGPNFQADHLHPTDAGQALQAVPWQAAITAVLAAP